LTDLERNMRMHHAMCEGQFWRIVDGVCAKAGRNLNLRVALLRSELEQMIPDQIIAFALQYHILHCRAYTGKLWAAIELLAGNLSDDSFYYFRDWLISEGSRPFDQAVAFPDSLYRWQVRDGWQLESFRYVAFDVFQEMTGRNFDHEILARPGELRGGRCLPEDVSRVLPRLNAAMRRRIGGAKEPTERLILLSREDLELKN